MSRLTRDGTAELVSRDQTLTHVHGPGNIQFPCSADHEQDWQPYPVGPYSAICDDHTYSHTYCWTPTFRIRALMNNVQVNTAHVQYRTVVVFALKTRSCLYPVPSLSCSSRQWNGFLWSQAKPQIRYIKVNKDQEKVPTLAGKHVTSSLKITSSSAKQEVGSENPKKEVEPIAPTRKLRHKQDILYRSGNDTCKTKLQEEAIPPRLRSRGVFIVGFPPTRPSPLNTLELWEGQNKINHADRMQDSTLCPKTVSPQGTH